MKRTASSEPEGSPKKAKAMLNMHDNETQCQGTFKGESTQSSKTPPRPIILNRVTGPGFGGRNFGFHNGFAVPIRPTLPHQPGGAFMRPQYPYHSPCRFPCPQNQQSSLRYPTQQSGHDHDLNPHSRTLKSSSLSNVEEESEHVQIPSSLSHSQSTPCSLAQESFSKIIESLPQEETKKNQSSHQEKQFHFHQYEFSLPWSEMKTKIILSSPINPVECHHTTDGEVGSNRVFQCCECNSRNVGEILGKANEKLGHMSLEKITGEKNQLSLSNSTTTKRHSDGQNDEHLKIKRKRGYGVQDDYVLNGKFVDANGQPEENEFLTF